VTSYYLRLNQVYLLKPIIATSMVLPVGIPKIRAGTPVTTDKTEKPDPNPPTAQQGFRFLNPYVHVLDRRNGPKGNPLNVLLPIAMLWAIMCNPCRVKMMFSQE
jgi:hypothetical protein